MTLTQTNPAPAVPALRYSVSRMLRDANVLIALLDTSLGMAWECPACAERGTHMDALAGAWVGLRDWRDGRWWLEDEWQAAGRRAQGAVSAFAAWYAGVLEVQA